MRNMRNWLSMLFFFLLLICCGEKRSQVKRTFENGVEIVINHLEPYKIVKASSLTLEETLKIDTERADIVNLGLTHVIGFEVNSLEKYFS